MSGKARQLGIRRMDLCARGRKLPIYLAELSGKRMGAPALPQFARMRNASRFRRHSCGYAGP